MKEFTTAVRAADEEDTFTFKIDGKEFVAYPPTPAQFAVVLAAVGRHTSTVTKIAGIIDFFVAILIEESASILTQRLMDRDDPFEVQEVEQILSWLIEEWGGHPTQEPSGSATPPSPTGPTLTTTSDPVTPSPSPSTAS